MICNCLNQIFQPTRFQLHQVSSMGAEIGENEQQILTLNDTVAAREREIKSLRRQLDAKTYEAEETNRLKDSASMEIKRLQEDLGEMTRECQVGF